ncbi:MAG TPA: hypothetical protein VIH05_06650 [Tepidiformaceae bacterium]
MTTRKLLAAGGLFASLVLVIAGIASIVIGYQGRQEVRDSLRQEQIVGPDDSTIPGQLVDTGSEARAQADIIRQHQLEATDGLTYSQMGRFASPDGDPKGTSNADEAAKDANGRPLPNSLRDRWITVTALSTSLNTAYFAEQVGLFSIVMGAALLLTGIGFAVLTAAALLHVQRLEESQTVPVRSTTPERT